MYNTDISAASPRIAQEGMGYMRRLRFSWLDKRLPNLAVLNTLVLALMGMHWAYVTWRLPLFLWLQRLWPAFREVTTYISTILAGIAALIYILLFLLEKRGGGYAPIRKLVPPICTPDSDTRIPQRPSLSIRLSYSMMRIIVLVLILINVSFFLVLVGNSVSLRLPTEMSIPIPGAEPIRLFLVDPLDSGPATSPAGYDLHVTEPFYLGIHEITESQWRAVMGTLPSPSYGEDYPAANMPWDKCQSFIERLRRTTPFASDIRLPRWAEWEYACQSGVSASFFGGEDILMVREHAWDLGNSGGKPHPVGLLPPNPWGFYDLVGNVSEWCEDFCDVGRASPVSPQTPGSQRAVCGGSFEDDVSNRVTWFVNLPRNLAFEKVGFRIASSSTHERR